MNKKIFLLIMVLCSVSIGYALYAQHYLGMDPCPLCMVQRLIIMVMIVVATIAYLHRGSSTLVVRIYAAIIFAFALFGIEVAAHHEWLTTLPLDQQPLSCGMPLALLYQDLPFSTFVHKILAGDAECGTIIWRVMGLHPPVAVIILCSIIAVLALVILVSKPKSRFN